MKKKHITKQLLTSISVDIRIYLPLKGNSRRPSGHLNGVSLEGRWWPDIECWLGSFVIRTSIAKKPYIFVIFHGGSRPPVPPLPQSNDVFSIEKYAILYVNWLRAEHTILHIHPPDSIWKGVCGVLREVGVWVPVGTPYLWGDSMLVPS